MIGQNYGHKQKTSKQNYGREQKTSGQNYGREQKTSKENYGREQKTSKENYGHKQKTNEGYNYPLGPSPFDYYSLKKLPQPQQMIGAGFGTRTMRDVMEWQNTMGSTPYPWGPDGQNFMFYMK